jgi:acetylornithine deacetylase/succinyl-diaminopimelate desuccinylase-like protein
MTPGEAIAYADSQRARFVEELRRLVRFPSVSSEPRHRVDIARCASWLADHMRRISLEHVRILPTPGGPPIVIAEWRHAPGRPTLLVYGHYDVQPAGPLDEWRYPPFAAVVRAGRLYGRGASDDKGQLFTHLKALEALLRTHGRLPVNVLIAFEGEEEIGSTSLLSLVRRPGFPLPSAAVISDTRLLGRGRPAITNALRGMLGARLTVRGPKREVHSGHYGGVVMDPATVLCRIIGGLHDPDGRIAIAGLYDPVLEWSRRERSATARVGPSDRQMLAAAGAQASAGEGGFSAYERATIRPALTVTELATEPQQAGESSIPTAATAFLDLRLVPRQSVRSAERQLRTHLARHVAPEVDVSLEPRTLADPVAISPQHPLLQAAARAYKTGFGAEPAFVRSGGSIPIAAALASRGVVPVLMGFALPEDGAHGPNERFELDNFFRGIATSMAFLTEVGRA